jgi:hypothetical protein
MVHSHAVPLCCTILFGLPRSFRSERKLIKHREMECVASFGMQVVYASMYIWTFLLWGKGDESRLWAAV